MLLSFDTALIEQLVASLGQKGSLSVHALQEEVRISSKHKYTAQAIYKELRKLLTAGVVIKNKKQFQLDTAWLENLNVFTKRAIEIHPQRYQLPKPGETLRHKFMDGHVMVRWWTDMTTVTLRSCQEQVVYEWAPHLWYVFINLENEKRFWEAARDLKIRYYMCCGSETSFDREYLKCVVSPHSVLLGRTPSWAPEVEHLSVLPPYIWKIRFSAERLRTLKKIFDSTETNSLSISRLVQEFIHGEGSTTVSLTNDREKAYQLHRKFKRFWG